MNTSHNLLDTLKFPDDLKSRSLDELETLAKEIRERLMSIGNTCGGHLASNLGVVELSLALHTVLDSPHDKIIWDTSHQCYTHKMLTGRIHNILTLRQWGGLSGFTKRNESAHDAFGSGHASTALSAALGIAHGREIKKESYKVCAIIGDSALAGGMTFEAINNAAKLNANLIVVLNDNDMAISKPVGSMSKYITRIRTSTTYHLAKRKIERILEHIPKIGVPLKKRIERVVERLREFAIETTFGVLFEEFGFKYIGPIDGHNIPMLMAALKYAKKTNAPTMVHIITKKGKGYTDAENEPTRFHGISAQQPTNTIKHASFTDAFEAALMEIAVKQNEIVAITPAMKDGSGLNAFAEKFPNRFFDVGIAEEHAVTFAAGLASAGLRPILTIYSSFLQRGYDQLVHDVCLQNLPVVFAIDRAGVVGEDGPTHHGTFDLAFQLHIPNLTLLAPKDGEELRVMLQWACLQNSPISIRYPRGGSPLPLTIAPLPQPGRAEILFEKSAHNRFEVLIIAVGHTAWPSVEAAQALLPEIKSMAVINLRWIKPYDTETVHAFIKKSKHVFVVEDGSAIGGVSSYLLLKAGEQVPISTQNWHTIALPDHFIEQGTLTQVRAHYHLTADSLIAKIKTIVN